ncbi:hypothetical protein F751_6845 [Auxenochlorella protothecoides]|uniref:Uncharacterized protein n=1 Tax=Auxenochlorella protothecoides TaxID=3075 RepID=A0A087SDS3_AUXPR|nr:hypothetical protein F751_6845 [Auxenochlorella protothecoides]KFM23877.1 hypothetical protein F751_6845 [Auxenochlorella protothecoides]
MAYLMKLPTSSGVAGEVTTARGERMEDAQAGMSRALPREYRSCISLDMVVAWREESCVPVLGGKYDWSVLGAPPAAPT